MATHIYRYTWNFIDIDSVNRTINPSFPISISNKAPICYIDIFADGSTKSDLDEIMADEGFSFDSTDPITLPPSRTLRQVIETRVSIDQSTTSVAFVDLLSLSITTQSGFLEIDTALATTILTTVGYVRLTLDGVPILDGGSGHSIGLGAHNISKRVPISLGVHTVALQWRVDILGTLQCRPATNPDQESGTLTVRETT